MRWFIEVSNVGSGDPDTQYCVEAKQWQAALQQARKLRGEAGPLSAFSIELLDNGYRAVDKKQNLKYVVKKAPNDAPLDDGKNGATNPAAEAHSGTLKPAGKEVSATPKAAEPEGASQPPTASQSSQGRISGPPKPRLDSTRPSGTAGKASKSKSSPPGTKGPQKVTELLAAAAQKAGEKSSIPAAKSGTDSAAPLKAQAKSGATPSDAGEPVTTEKQTPSSSADVAQQPPARANSVGKAPSEQAPSQKATAAGMDSAVALAPAPTAAASEAESAGAPAAASAAAPKTEAVPVPEYEVIRSRGEEPSKETPITYREVALGVRPGLSRASLGALLLARYRSEKKELADRPKGKFVQLAVFDHVFSKKPIRPPLATLQWKDWRGDPILNFSELIESASATASELAPADEAPTGSLRPTSVIPVDETTGSRPPPPDSAAPEAGSESSAAASTGQSSPATALASDAANGQEAQSQGESSPPDSAGGEAEPVPLTKQKDSKPPAAEGAAPSDGKRKSIGEDLIGVLFEKMHDLHFQRDVVQGSEFVLSVVKQALPSAYALVHVFDINTKNFVVVRQHGTSEKALMFQTPDKDTHLRRMMRPSRSTNMKGTAQDKELLSGRWQVAQVTPDCLLCGPVKQGGRYLGLIELGNPVGSKPFAEVEANALDYICEQFAEFLANRPIVLDADVVLK